MSKIALYAHGGSGNHGCEAIVRSLVKQLNLVQSDVLLSNRPNEDIKYGIDKLLTVKDATVKAHKGLLYKLRAKLSGNVDKFYYEQKYRNIPQLVKGCDVAYSIGGDNYCYRGLDLEMMVMRRLVASVGVKTILMGCSVEPKTLSEEILEDMKLYDTIYCRESMTFEALVSYGFKNLKLRPDSAFCLDRADLPLPEGFLEKKIVGVNLSPLVIQKGVSNEMVLKNYIRLIEYILSQTGMNVALIPHVVWSGNDDRVPLKELYDRFYDTGRVVMMEDHNAEELKGYIARCKYMVAARTHASIAAYSTKVPTLVVGYSIKARGIAKDLFGTDEGYVIPVQSMKSENDLVDRFVWLIKNTL
jgi:polysaccharide pyruvyl transferase WcaK-like protein